MALWRLLPHASRICTRRNTRGMSDWLKPRFVDGKAEPHELWKKFKQTMYTDGEVIASSVGCFILTMYFTVQAMSKEFREEEARQVDFNCMTQLRYPDAIRDES